jgi:hypothetical protein
MNIQAKPPHKKINWKQIVFIAVILGIALFQYVRTEQADEQGQRDGGQGVAQLDLPDNLDLDGSLGKNSGAGDAKSRSGNNNSSSGNSSSGNSSKTSDRGKNQSSSSSSGQPYLKEGRRGTKVSPAGLVYTGSRSGEHRTEHVLRHAKHQPNRPGNHGVFDADGDDVFRLIDEAYALIQKNSRQVSKDPPRDGKTAYLVDMKRRIGYRGGKSGNRAGKPVAKKMKLILAEDRVITAYPY